VSTAVVSWVPTVPSPATPDTSVAGELVARMVGELPALSALSGLAERERLLTGTWLSGLRAAGTRRAYSGDLLAWWGWLG
jgi:hypothetical protein